MQPVALITGITGQDGSYLAEFLLGRGYEVHGIVSRPGRRPPAPDVVLHTADLTDTLGLLNVCRQVQPTEVYHLAAQSRVGESFANPFFTADITGLGTVRLLEAIRAYQSQAARPVRFFNAGSSEMYGRPLESPQSETTPFRPSSPYGCAKLLGYWQTVNAREGYGLFACNAILFNHESPRRSEGYVTRKITRAAARIKLGLQKQLTLGNTDVRRDWGFAGDYVEAMWRMLQQEEPDDYVLATGESHSVREFVEEAFRAVGLNWEDHVEIDPGLIRPTDAPAVCGDATKARRILGWRPRVGFRELVDLMVAHDLKRARP